MWSYYILQRVQQAFRSGWRLTAFNIREVNKATEYTDSFVDGIILCTCRHFAQESESHDNGERQSKIAIKNFQPHQRLIPRLIAKTFGHWRRQSNFGPRWLSILMYDGCSTRKHDSISVRPQLNMTF